MCVCVGFGSGLTRNPLGFPISHIRNYFMVRFGFRWPKQCGFSAILAPHRRREPIFPEPKSLQLLEGRKEEILMKCRRFLSIPVLAVFLLLGFVYYATVFVFINDWVGLQTSAGLLNTLIFTVLVSLCIFSFSVSVLTDPGHVPSSYVPDVEDSVGSDQEVKITSAQVGQCDKCSAYKPPRAHHCKVCRRCVLRMDHHCLWISNCVGHWNYKAFFLLVCYATTGSIYSMVMIISSAFHKDWDFGERLPLKIFYVSCGVMVVLLSLTLGTLLGWHIYLIIHNMTTIEYHEGKRAAWLARKSGQSIRHPFDVGVYKNITLVLGPNMLTWLCPTAVSHLKDGTSFPTLRHSS